MIRFLAAVFALLILAPQAHAASGFDEVMKTRTLRCAYAPITPFIVIDPATHQVSGLMVDLVNTIGERLNLKIDWSQEVGWGQIAEGMNTGKYDAFCGEIWQTAGRAGAMSFSTPTTYHKVFPCVSGKTNAYDASTDTLNAADKTFYGYDGDISMQTVKNLFPNAKATPIPDTMTWAEALQSVADGKADAIATCDKITVDGFNKNNPEKTLKIAAPDHPITVVNTGLALPLGDVKLKNMIDVTINEMVADGTLETLFKKYLNDYLGNTIILPKALP
jgi:ABC-type amino acid transport substrate-binding protein